MNKIRVIDLLNKIAKGEEAPKQITTNRKKFYLVKKNTIDNDYDYEDENGQYFISYLNEYYYTTDYLNMEIEIIEEEQEIEHYDYSDNPDVMFPENIAHNFQKLNEDLDVIVRELNKIKKEGK